MCEKRWLLAAAHLMELLSGGREQGWTLRVDTGWAGLGWGLPEIHATLPFLGTVVPLHPILRAFLRCLKCEVLQVGRDGIGRRFPDRKSWPTFLAVARLVSGDF